MRVAFLLDKFPKISETFILHQIRQLQLRGVDFAIFASRPANEPEVHHEVHYLLPHVRYYGGPGSRKSAAGAALGILKKGSWSSVVRLIAAGHPAPRFAALCRCIEGGIGEFDIVHCHFGPIGQFGASLKAAGGIRGKLVTAFHGYDLTRYPFSELGHYRPLFRHGDLFMPVSERFRDTLIALGCEPGKVVVHRMGLEVEKIPYRPRSWNGEPHVTVITIGRLVEKKGIAYGIGAVARLTARVPNLRYWIVGDGPERPDLEALVRDHGLERSVRLWGWRSQDEVRRLLKEAHIMLVPSVMAADGDQEGIPVVMMEAMASGIPVIATNHSGIPESVSDGETGYLVPERDSEAIAFRLERVIRRGAGEPEVLGAARRRVERNYNLNHLSDQLIAHYQRLIQGPGNA